MKDKRQDRLLPNTMRNLDDLAALLDREIDITSLPIIKPLTPSQSDKLVRVCFRNILDEIHKTRLLFLQKHSNINEIRDASKRVLERETRRNKKVINPKTITIPRSIEVFDKRLALLEGLFQEVLTLYERQTGKAYIPGGSVK